MLDGNKVTVEDVHNAVVDTVYDVLSDGKTTVCTLTLYNGFTVRGESSVVDPSNFNTELGQQNAREKALDNVWPVLGAILAEKLHSKRMVNQSSELKEEAAIEIAQGHAAALKPSYYEEGFIPHDWVIEAIRYGYSLGRWHGLTDPSKAPE